MDVGIHLVFDSGLDREVIRNHNVELLLDDTRTCPNSKEDADYIGNEGGVIFTSSNIRFLRRRYLHMDTLMALATPWPFVDSQMRLEFKID